jgi:hypothetical protein
MLTGLTHVTGADAYSITTNLEICAVRPGAKHRIDSAI